MELNVCISIVCVGSIVFLAIIMWCIYRHVMIKKVANTSQNISGLLKLNQDFSAEQVPQKLFHISHPVKSYRSFVKTNFSDVVLYYIENDINTLRSNIVIALRNKKLYETYLQKVKKLNSIPSNDMLADIKMTHKKFYKYERIATKKFLLKEPYHVVTKITVFYRSPKGRNFYQKKTVFQIDDLEAFYLSWCQKKNYAISAKFERSIMTDSLRYDVMRRDNFACQICGATSADGAKLHVDHIVPVSKGGKTVLSNLQTLCERCNLGKSNKT